MSSGGGGKVRVVSLPKLSVEGTGEVVVCECGGCGALGARCSWRDADLGLLCRKCSVVQIEAQLVQVFPNAKWNGGLDE